MLRSIISASLRFRLLVVAVAAGVLAVGVAQLRDAPVDVLPEFTPPYAEIQTEALGLSAEEVEELVTVPLEADLLNGVEGVDVIRSQSLPSLSSIVMVFEPGTDVYRARQLIQERLTQAHALPNVSAPPTLLQPLSSSSRVLMIGLSSDRLTPIERSVIARWTVRPRLMGVPGVANVAVWGMRDQQLQVQVDPERLRDRGVRLNQVVRTAGNAQAVSPLSFLEASTPGTGGFVENRQQRMQVRNVLDQLADPGDLGRVPVEGSRGRLRLADVADVRVDHQPLIGDAVLEGGEGPLLVVEKFPGASTLEVTEGVEDALETLRPGLAGMQTDSSIFRPASFIEEAVDNLRLTVLIGAALAALGLAAFVFRWRTLLIALVAVPVSLVAAALVLDALGESFNAISFAGLAVAMAVVVDEAVVGADALARRLREHREAGGAGTESDVIASAAGELRAPLGYATLIALLAIVPIAVMEGRPGAFLRPFVLAYVLAVAAATLVALTLTPALGLLLGARGRPSAAASPVVRRLQRGHRRALAAAGRRPAAVLTAALACGVATLVAVPLMGAPSVPAFKDRDVLVQLEAEPGTSAPRMARIASSMARELRSVPGVDSVGAHVGRAVGGDARVDVSSGEVWIAIDAGADYADTLDNVEDVVARTDGARGELATYSMQKVRDVGALVEGDNPVRGRGLDVLTGAADPLVVRVYGKELGELRREAERVRGMLDGVDGVVDARVKPVREQPTVEITVDLARAQRLGIKPGDVRRAEATLVQGIHVGSVFQDQKVFDVVVRGVPRLGRSVQGIRDLLIDRPGGGHVRLADVADVAIVRTPIAIDREAVSRFVEVTAGVDGRGTGAVAADVRRRLAAMSLPLQTHAEVVDTGTGREIGATRMLIVGLAAALACFLLLQAAFRSWTLAAIVSALLPAALTGGVAAALIAGDGGSIGALGGLLAVLAIAVRAVVVLVRRLQELELRDRVAFGPELLERATAERLPAVLASVAALALLAAPAAVLGSRPGLEVVHPLAVVLLGGLVTSLLVTLFAVPIAYLRLRPAVTDPEVEEGAGMVRQWTGLVRPPDVPAPSPAGGNGSGQ